MVLNFSDNDNRKNFNIIIKRHPDAILGGKKSYYSDSNIKQYLKDYHNVFLIDYDINPYCLFNIVDEVHVVTSGMGFEALMANKKVYCYGNPFYSGWGLTYDKQPIARRNKHKKLEEIFYGAYIKFSRYYDPIKKQEVNLESLINYIIENRGKTIT